MELISQIVNRGKPLNRLRLHMDLDACNSNGCPLDFSKLLAFPDFDFFHDINGIQMNIDRETGRLKNNFLPRCVKNQ